MKYLFIFALAAITFNTTTGVAQLLTDSQVVDQIRSAKTEAEVRKLFGQLKDKNAVGQHGWNVLQNLALNREISREEERKSERSLVDAVVDKIPSGFRILGDIFPESSFKLNVHGRLTRDFLNSGVRVEQGPRGQEILGFVASHVHHSMGELMVRRGFPYNLRTVHDFLKSNYDKDLTREMLARTGHPPAAELISRRWVHDALFGEMGDLVLQWLQEGKIKPNEIVATWDGRQSESLIQLATQFAYRKNVPQVLMHLVKNGADLESAPTYRDYDSSRYYQGSPAKYGLVATTYSVEMAAVVDQVLKQGINIFERDSDGVSRAIRASSWSPGWIGFLRSRGLVPTTADVNFIIERRLSHESTRRDGSRYRTRSQEYSAWVSEIQAILRDHPEVLTAGGQTFLNRARTYQFNDLVLSLTRGIQHQLSPVENRMSLAAIISEGFYDAKNFSRAEELVNAGWKIEPVDEMGRTLAHLIASAPITIVWRNNEGKRIIKLLNKVQDDYGVSLAQRDHSGKTPLDVAIAARNTPMILYLAEYSPVTLSMVAAANEGLRDDVVSKLMERLNVEDAKADPASAMLVDGMLEKVIKYGKVSVLRFLVVKGLLSPTATVRMGYETIPLVLAVAKHSGAEAAAEMIPFLLERGARATFTMNQKYHGKEAGEVHHIADFIEGRAIYSDIERDYEDRPKLKALGYSLRSGVGSCFLPFSAGMP